MEDESMRIPPSRRAVTWILLCGFFFLSAACSEIRPREESTPAGEGVSDPLPPALGPRDGLHLPAKDLERVAVGTEAPDFSLRTLEGDTITLSDFRGAKDVILVFYRGHW